MNGGHAIGIVSGSGLDLSAILDAVDQHRSFDEFPGLPRPSVPGHDGCFDIGTSHGKTVILQRGRLHVAEGYPVRQVQQTVDILQHLGASTILFTNAAGGLRPEMNVGDLVGIESAMLWPFAGWPDSPDTVSLSVRLDGCDHYGPYLWVHGPAYETPDEIRFMRNLGAAAVGMSTAPELERCRELGISAGAVSCITNNCCVPQHLDHRHVIDAAQAASNRIVSLLRDHIRESTP